MDTRFIQLYGFTYEEFKQPTKENKEWLFEEVYESCWGLSVNLNDRFGWALGMSDYIWADDWWDLLPLVYEFKNDAIHAYFSLKLGIDVIEPLKNDDYFNCKEYIKELKDNHDLFHFFDYNEGVTPIGFKNEDRLDEDINEICNLYNDIINSIGSGKEYEKTEKWEMAKKKFIERLN